MNFATCYDIGKDVIPVFFFFFDFEEQPLAEQALQMACGDKLAKDGYCDMSEYIYGRIDKDSILTELLKSDSPLAELYKMSYFKEETARQDWNHIFQKYFAHSLSPNEERKLTFLEARAIVNWIYRAYANADRREEVTKELLSFLGERFHAGRLAFAHGVIYQKSEIEICPITSFGRFHQYIKDVQTPGNTIFYRGHADVNYTLLPSVMRSNGWLTHECDLYNETVIECPGDFDRCRTHLDYLVEMQHYGLPTRLLDVTQNPLVALYFACMDSPKSQGELIVFDVKREEIKYPKSDTVSMLASLPLFKDDMKQQLYDWATDPTLTQKDFNLRAVRLLHEIKLEKPAFRDEMVKSDLTNCFFVLAEKKNARIMKQDGAFIICGLFDTKNSIINKYRYQKHGKKQIFIIDRKVKKEILAQLNKLSINKAQLFPEIQDVTAHIKSKY